MIINILRKPAVFRRVRSRSSYHAQSTTRLAYGGTCPSLALIRLAGLAWPEMTCLRPCFPLLSPRLRTDIASISWSWETVCSVYLGSGKSTCLCCIAGLEKRRRGRGDRHHIQSSRHFAAPPAWRALGYKVQDVNLFRHLMVAHPGLWPCHLPPPNAAFSWEYTCARRYLCTAGNDMLNAFQRR